MPDRPLLTGQWRNLLLLNFEVPHDVIAPLAPTGTEPEFHDGRAYISVVGFEFQNTRLFGVPFPGHTNFIEINLRFYVRRVVGNELRRGVVFVREIAPRRAVAIVANRLYNENYIIRKMRNNSRITSPDLTPGDVIGYSWKTAANGLKFSERLRFSYNSAHWNCLSAQVAAPLALPEPNSLNEFLVENYWGYSRTRDGRAREYRVAHIPWRVAPVDNVVWECDVAANYPGPLAEFLTKQPTTALIADGSPIQVFPGKKI